MMLLNGSEREQLSTYVRDRLATLRRPVKLVTFTADRECQYCDQARRLVETLAKLSELITSAVYDLAADRQEAAAYGVDRVPTIAIVGDGADSRDDGVRFYGVPAGYEFTTLIEAIVDVSVRELVLSEETQVTLERLKVPVHLQVFVTPTCPVCPAAVRLAHKLAVASPCIYADMVDVTQLPDLAARYQIESVPRTIINETCQIEGVVSEAELMKEVEKVGGCPFSPWEDVSIPELEIDRRILQRLEAVQGILDVGCGEGRLVNFLARQTQKRVVGLDISNHGFARAKQEADQTAIPDLVECVQGDAQQMAAIKDGRLEVVTLTFTLHHIEDPETALQEIHRVLRPACAKADRPGGQVLIGDWVVGEGQPRSECHRFTVGELRRMLEEAEFRQVEVEQVEPDLVLVVGEKGQEL